MDDTDAFFTQTIVGAPFSVLLGRRMGARRAPSEGIEVDLSKAEMRLSRGWKDWIVMRQASDHIGQPRPRPGRVRRWLERHALWLALLGLLSLVMTAALWGG